MSDDQRSKQQPELQLRQQRTWYLQRLDVLLRRCGRFGTALIDANGENEESWGGLLVWDITEGAHCGVTVRCDKEPGSRRWVHRLEPAQTGGSMPDDEPPGTPGVLGEVLGNVDNLEVVVSRLKNVVLGVTRAP